MTSLQEKYPLNYDPLHRAEQKSVFGTRVYVKEGVNTQGLHGSMRNPLFICKGVYGVLGRRLVITSGKRDEGSWVHREGKAMDIRTFFLPLYEMQLIGCRIRAALGGHFDVLLEHDPPHLHLEFDPYRRQADEDTEPLHIYGEPEGGEDD